MTMHNKNPDAEIIYCYACKKEVEIDIIHKLSRFEECPHCKKDLHCCKMCTFYDPAAYNECRESMAQRVVEKEKSNFCDYFSLEKNVLARIPAREKLKNAATSLFKK